MFSVAEIPFEGLADNSPRQDFLPVREVKHPMSPQDAALIVHNSTASPLWLRLSPFLLSQTL